MPKRGLNMGQEKKRKGFKKINFKKCFNSLEGEVGKVHYCFIRMKGFWKQDIGHMASTEELYKEKKANKDSGLLYH